MPDCQEFWIAASWTWKDILGFVWDLAKAAVPVWVAWVAYKVSDEAKQATQAQRDIAANQYKISLYEIRSRHLDDLNIWINKNVELKYQDCGKQSGINYILNNILCTFPFDNLVGEIFSSLEKLLKMKNEISLINISVSKRIRRPGDTIEERSHLDKLCDDEGEKILKMLENLAVMCRQSLKVPQSPY